MPLRSTGSGGRGAGGGTGFNGFWYTKHSDSYAYWHFGDLRGLFKPWNYYPGQDAYEKGSCTFLRFGCSPRPPTASPRYKIWQLNDGGWDVVDDLQTSILDSKHRYKEGWWPWDNIELDGYIVVEVRKRWSDDKYRLAADSFRFGWEDLLPEDKRVAKTACRASALEFAVNTIQYEALANLIMAVLVSAAGSVATSALMAALPRISLLGCCVRADFP